MGHDILPQLVEQPRKPNGDIIPELVITKENFINRSTAVYGKTNSGKSTIMRNIIYCLKGHIEMAFVFSATENQNDTYKDIIPIAAIDTNTDSKHVYEFLKLFWDRQQVAAQVYRKATRLNILIKLYEKVATPKDNDRLNKIKRYEAKISSGFKRLIESKPESERNYYADERTLVMDNISQLTIEFYRKVIKKYEDKFKTHKLSSDELFCIQYVGFRPHSLLIFDDCMHLFPKKFQSLDAFRSIFVAGRHNFITIILAAHLRSHLDKTTNENVARSIYCTKEVAANAAIRQDTTSPEEVNEFKECIRSVFNIKHKHRKLAYITGCPDPYRWICATPIPFEPDEHKRKYIGSKYFIKICQNVIVKGDKFDENNPFTADFTASIKKLSKHVRK